MSNQTEQLELLLNHHKFLLQHTQNSLQTLLQSLNNEKNCLKCSKCSKCTNCRCITETKPIAEKNKYPPPGFKYEHSGLPEQSKLSRSYYEHNQKNNLENNQTNNLNQNFNHIVDPSVFTESFNKTVHIVKHDINNDYVTIPTNVKSIKEDGFNFMNSKFRKYR